ncbi:sensor histidine kinase [Spirosoma rhododendri]|uniref:histidine kinase n=1 Tax=Spirosoma rhododendri TaxID=2728024 RepID=A0A7L5DND0_9BACT|nr:sensor histidine kinase [Spirosoma rhododendri]QJD77260.1 hypothetical protein HH216_01610 [Spirosoma rhododendri]
MGKRLSILVVVLVLHIGSVGRLRAQAPNVWFDQLTEADGLPGGAVYSITKDRQGFIWFGTRRCPVRYDGSTFRPFLLPETYLVTGLAADSANRMWLASDRRGICRIEPNALHLTPVPNTPTATGRFYRSTANEGWFGDTSGIGRIDLRTGVVRHYPLRHTTYRGIKVQDFLEDSQRTLWVVGSDNGLFRFDRRANRFVCVLGPDCADPARRLSVYLSRGCVDAQGILWIGSYDHGLLRFDPHTSQFTFFTQTGRPAGINCVAEGQDETGRRLLWVGDESGLLAFRPEQQRFVAVPVTWPDPFAVYALFRDPGSGMLWVGTSDGVLKYNPQDSRVEPVTLPPALVRQPVLVNVICPDQRDTTGQTFWLGLSHTGLIRWHRPTNQFTLVRYPESQAETMWVQQTGDGRLWIGLRNWSYRGDGVLVYDPSAGRFVPEPAAQRAGRLFSVPFVDHGLIDRQQRLWVGNNDEGLRVLAIQTGQPLHYWPEAEIRAMYANNNFLTDIKADKAGQIWLATYRGPYCVTEPGHRFVPADHHSRRQFDDPATNALLVARSGHVWAARWGSVTESAPDGTLLTVLTSRNGLYDRETRRLAEDGAGRIWIGTCDGLQVYDPRTRQIRRFTVGDGLSRTNVTAALYIHRGRELFVGQQNGFDYIVTDRLLHRESLPPVVVNSLRIQERERSFDAAKPIRLSPADNAFSVGFSVMTYDRMPTSQYAYRLDGFDTGWNYSGTHHRAYYTNLAPGRYVLSLKAANAAGQWSRQVTQLAIDVLPAYYQTWWFRLLIGLLFAGGLYGLYRYRINQILRVQRIRNRISADLHDEIGSSISGIDILGTMIQRGLPKNHPSEPMVERIVSEARQVSSALDDIVWSINPTNDGLGSLIARINRYAAELFEASGIQYEIAIPDGLDRLSLSMEKRQDFYLIAKEAVNNMVKHAQATQARLLISYAHPQLHLTVWDNGRGFDTNADTDRNGLRNMQTRARQLGGTLQISSAPGQGTSLRLTFPVSA